jgi:uncharacterized protein YmfQ (DUF2313 family)
MPDDKHIRRDGDKYGTEFLTYLPQGQAWPRQPGTTLDLACRGLVDYYGTVDGRAADLLEIESDPRHTVELLPDWERNWGLPEECIAAPQSIGERQLALVHKMTMIGGQSRQYFINLAASIGYTITISEYAPFMVGVSQVGDTRTPPLDPNPLVGDYRWYIGGPEMRFYWTVHVGQAKLIWFRCDSGQTGVDPHLRIGIADDLECILNKYKPAQTKIVFDYSGLTSGGSMAGTP